MVYKIKSVKEHVEVYDNQGHFLFSADNQQEALDELLLESDDVVVA